MISCNSLIINYLLAEMVGFVPADSSSINNLACFEALNPLKPLKT